ncbi:MAG: hypothetical protein ACOZB0_14005 [Pseudomonadota bacterium]
MTRLWFTALLVLASPQGLAFPTYASGEGFRGAELMTPEERQAHVSKMQSFRSFEECQAYVTAHETEIQKRAAAKQVTLPARNTGVFDGDPCKVMRFMGRIK